ILMNRNFFAVTTERFCFLSAVSMYHLASPLIRIYLLATNAALRGECRIKQLSADHFTTKTYCIPKMPRGMNPSLTLCYIFDFANTQNIFTALFLNTRK
ncbi:hypothetical protein, partial [Vibrio vulnificus]|uniref:hypothetical protein n=1 Tax=Vibrio vulnificus TaxID=672 RepID=UPI0039B4B1A0